MKSPQPFLRWVGGKRRLLHEILPLLPETPGRLVIPFLGGGAVTLAAASVGWRVEASDLDVDLMCAWRQVQASAPELAELCESWPQTEDGYYAVRDLYAPESDLERAARIVWLNRLCFNGLFRKNRKGQLNMSWGKFKRWRGFTPGELTDGQWSNPWGENLLAVQTALESVNLSARDFSAAIASTGPGDVLYLDPPYWPVGARGFRGYTGDFTAQHHELLALLARDAAERGVLVIASNAWVPEVLELYQGFEIRQVFARRSVNCSGAGRGPVPEMLAVAGPRRS